MNYKFTVKVLLFVAFLLSLQPNILGITDNFKFVIDTIGIPRYNVYSEEINEDIYNTYNIFVYSSPQGVAWNSTQRFKSVPIMGKWTRYNGMYTGIGERGEYYLLGTSYSGSVISNVYFPVDGFPETTPDKWVYIIANGAYESWFDKSKYKYDEQLEYMKKTDLLFDEMNLSTRTINSYNLVSYNISVNKIGMDKMNLNAASTWKTNGIVTARRISATSKMYDAIFATAPMAANADVTSQLKVDDSYVMKENERKIIIPIAIATRAINLNNYANKKHIKEIVSILYVNGKEIARISGSKTDRLDKLIYFSVSRDDYNIPNTYPLDIKVKSYLYTEFSVDGLMQHEVQKRINLQVIANEVIPIKSIKVSMLEKDNDNLVIRPLVQTSNTYTSGSEGIIESGRYLAVRLEKNIDNIDFECYINSIRANHEIIYQDEKYVVLKVCIYEKLLNSIKSWYYLRDESKNYFDIDFSEIGERIREPNILRVKCNQKYSKTIKFDNIDKFSNNINYFFEKDVLNIDGIKNITILKDWALNGQ